MGEPLLTKTDVASLLKVCKRQVDRLVRGGQLPPPKYLERHPRWRESEIVAWMQADCPAARDGEEVRA